MSEPNEPTKPFQPTRGPTRRGRMQITCRIAPPGTLPPNPSNPFFGMDPVQRRRLQLVSLAEALAKLPLKRPRNDRSGSGAGEEASG